MGIFDFFKRKELDKIKKLEHIINEKDDKINSLSRFKSLTDIEDETNSLKIKKEEVENEYLELKEKYSNALNIYNQLKEQISIFQEDLSMAEFGVYHPHFEFDTLEEYKNKINTIRKKQKEMIKSNAAFFGGYNIAWNGSFSKGEAMVKRVKKLMMRAFNGESDSFIANVDWNNVLKMEERIRKSFEAINNVYSEQGVYIRVPYLDLKIKELRLAYEYKKKRKEEKDEQRAIREQMREEEKVEREIEAARLKAEKEEEMYLKALEKARKEIGSAVGNKHEELLKRIAELEKGLIGAETLKQKALSMAQQTKMGYVYVISNIGSFGHDVYKIGMTRRLEPMDRVRELGDASVPFPFDVHAMIFSKNAPELESKLHSIFSDNRLNMMNTRKEFFNVSLEDIKNEVQKLGAKIDFTMLAEAEQYRESKRLKIKDNIAKKTEFPEFI